MLPHQTIRSDIGQSPLAQSPTPFDDDSDDKGAPTVIADTETGHLDSELDIGLDYLPPFTAVGTVGSRQGDVAEAFGSSLAAPAATSSSAMPGSDPCQSPLAQSPTPIDDDSDDSPAPTVIADTDIGHLASELAMGLATECQSKATLLRLTGSFWLHLLLPHLPPCLLPPRWLQQLLNPVQFCLLLRHLWPCPLQHPWLQPLMLMSLRSRSFQ